MLERSFDGHPKGTVHKFAVTVDGKLWITGAGFTKAERRDALVSVFTRSIDGVLRDA